MVIVLRMTHRVIITNICAKLFQIILIMTKLWTGQENMMDGQTSRLRDGGTERLSISQYFLQKDSGQKLSIHLTPTICTSAIYDKASVKV
jgi:hypothetical protein